MQADTRLLLTADKGFADARARPPGAHHGIVLLRLTEESIEGYRGLLRTLLESTGLERCGGTITVVPPDRVRIRRY